MRKVSWNSTENTSPNASLSLRGTTAIHSIDERSKDSSQKKALRIRIITRTGSGAIVKTNMARAGPYAVKAHPKKAVTVILMLIVYGTNEFNNFSA